MQGILSTSIGANSEATFYNRLLPPQEAAPILSEPVNWKFPATHIPLL